MIRSLRVGIRDRIHNTQGTLMRRSTVLNHSFQLAFPAPANDKHTSLFLRNDGERCFAALPLSLSSILKRFLGSSEFPTFVTILQNFFRISFYVIEMTHLPTSNSY
jgi:hypothetical protein